MWYYALIVAALSLAGATLPLRFKPGHAHLQIYLSLAAGALLGAALFHLLPESGEYIHAQFGLPAALGVMVVFFLQRYLAPHSHEVSPVEAEHQHGHMGEHHHEHEHQPPGEHARKHVTGQTSGVHDEHDHFVCEQASDPQHVCERHQATGPFLTGMVAVLALSIHSLFDGIALGAASHQVDGSASLVLSVFLSVLIHKPMDGLSVSVLLMQAGVQRRTLWMVQIFYAALVPIGAVVFQVFEQSLADATALVGYTLAFSGGTFLAIALTDLLPELHFHTHDRNKLSAALLLGLVVMWLTSAIGHGEHAHGEAAPAATPSETEDHEGHEH